MRVECIQAVAKALGRPLKAGEADSIEGLIRKAMRTLKDADPQAFIAKSRADRFTEAGQIAAEDILAEAQLKQRRVALQAAAVQRVAHVIAEGRAAGLSSFNALDHQVAFHADGKTNVQSIETQAKAIYKDAVRQMLDTLEASNPKWFGLLENQQGVEAIIRSLFGEDSGSPEAKRGAEQFHTVAEALRQRMNRAGGDIGKLKDWNIPQHHSQLRVAKAAGSKVTAENQAAWVSKMLDWVDRSKYVTDAGEPMTTGEITDFLRAAWDTISSGGLNKLVPGQFKGNGARANRGSQERQIHFKDAESYIAYQKEFGERSMYEVLIGHIQNIAKDVALVETFGPNPDATFRLFRDQALRDEGLADRTNLGNARKAAVRSENLYNVVSGKRLPVASEWLAKSFDTLRSWLVASRLGSAVISSFSDDATLHLTAHILDLPEMQLIKNELAALNPTNKIEERMANRAGLALDTMVATLNRFGQDELGTSFASKLGSTVLRASGLFAMTEARRRAFGVTAMHAIGSVVREHDSLAALDSADKRLLKARGITEADFKVWKAAEPEDWGNGNDTMLTPDAIYRLTDEQLRAIDPNENPQALREKAATRLLGIVLEETDVAVVEPGAVERAISGAGLQRGTWKGELTRSFFLFKSFPMAMLLRHWKRGMSLDNNLTSRGRAPYIAALIASTTVMGALSLEVSEILKGRDPRRLFGEGSFRNWIAAMLKGGSLGIYGDFLFSEQTQHGGSALGSLAGPVAGELEDVIGLTQGNAVQAMEGKTTNIGAESVKFVKGNLPGANLWYAKAALDHMIFDRMQEYYSPGYLRKMTHRAQTEFGQSYWWEPGEVAPERAPDLGAVVGE
jgi:hypothetical protein